MASSWIVIPTDQQLRNKGTWKKLPAHNYAVMRFHLLMVREIGDTIKNGPIESAQARVPGTKSTETRRVKNIVNKSEQIEQTISASVLHQISSEVISKVGGSLSVSKDFSAALSSEIQEKELESLTHNIQEGLKSVQSFSWTIENENTNSTEQVTPEESATKDSVTYTSFYKLREHVWSIYLMQTDYMRLTYKGYAIPWFDSRAIVTEKSKQTRRPLFRIRFYEPLPELSLTQKPYTPDVKDAKEILLRVISGPSPSKTVPPHTALLELAKEAFPATSKEHKKVKQRKKTTKAKTASTTGRYVAGSRPHASAKRKSGVRSSKRKTASKSTSKARKVVKKVAKKTVRKAIKKPAVKKQVKVKAKKASKKR